MIAAYSHIFFGWTGSICKNILKRLIGKKNIITSMKWEK